MHAGGADELARCFSSNIALLHDRSRSGPEAAEAARGSVRARRVRSSQPREKPFARLTPASPLIEFVKNIDVWFLRVDREPLMNKASIAKPTAKGEALRKAILDAASKLFIERGLGGTSMQDIADALRRTGRVSHEELREHDPDFVAKYESLNPGHAAETV
jgi:hypothetical protein